MKQYLVWEPDEGDTIEDAVDVQADNAYTAAEEYAKALNEEYDQDCLSRILCVKYDYEGEAVYKFMVTLAYEPVYYASLFPSA